MLWHHLTMLVYAAGMTCTAANAAVQAEFVGVSTAIGRYSTVGIPWPTPVHAQPIFAVTAWVSPNTMPYDAYPTLFAKSLPGATCSATVVYSTGRSPVSFAGSAQTIGSNGEVQWSWHEETAGSGGTATVDCTYQGRDQTATATFTVQ
jgi:hypothetical protein